MWRKLDAAIIMIIAIIEAIIITAIPNKGEGKGNINSSKYKHTNKKM